MDCRDAQFYLRMRRHATDELGPDVTAPLRDHLSTCPACAADSRALESFDRALASAMVKVQVPSGLRDRLVAQAAVKRSAILRRKTYQAASLTAAALLLIGIGISVFTITRPRLDPDALVRTNGELYADPEGFTRQWLAAQNLPDRLPLPFDYDLLVSCQHEHVQGRDVPVVTFRDRHGSGFAKVYLFPHDGRFDLKNVQEANSSHARAEVFVKQEGRGVTYVFVHTGGPDGLRHFFRTGGGTSNA